MPFPFEDFNCGKYITIPKKTLELAKDTIDQALTLAIGKALEAMIGLVDCELKLEEILPQDKTSFVVKFTILIYGKEKVLQTKTVSIIVDINTKTAEFLSC